VKNTAKMAVPQYVLIHEYGEVKQERIWKVVKENIPQLIKLLKQFV